MQSCGKPGQLRKERRYSDEDDKERVRNWHTLFSLGSGDLFRWGCLWAVGTEEDSKNRLQFAAEYQFRC
jgi:hypothetical protein